MSGATPLGRVIKGFGNNGEDGLEGVQRDNLIGTYLHGPLLPKNAWLADELIALALERRYGKAPGAGAAGRCPGASGARVGSAGCRRLTASAPAGAEAALAAGGLGKALGLDRIQRGRSER